MCPAGQDTAQPRRVLMLHSKNASSPLVVWAKRTPAASIFEANPLDVSPPLYVDRHQLARSERPCQLNSVSIEACTQLPPA